MVSRDTDTSGTGLTASGDSYSRVWPVADANFNTVALVVMSDGSATVGERYAYDPFGTVIYMTGSYGSESSSAYGWVYLFQGGRLDTITEDTNFDARNENSTLGTWTSEDPLGYAGGNVNLYGYESNNSIGWVDPQGLDDWQLVEDTRDPKTFEYSLLGVTSSSFLSWRTTISLSYTYWWHSVGEILPLCGQGGVIKETVKTSQTITIKVENGFKLSGELPLTGMSLTGESSWTFSNEFASSSEISTEMKLEYPGIPGYKIKGIAWEKMLRLRLFVARDQVAILNSFNTSRTTYEKDFPLPVFAMSYYKAPCAGQPKPKTSGM